MSGELHIDRREFFRRAGIAGGALACGPGEEFPSVDV
jgi:hypothetical protein